MRDTAKHKVTVVGIDEVGRGPWAGPVVACAAILNKPVQGLKDSKKLTAKKRQELDILIRENGRVGLGWVSAKEIDNLGLTKAVKKAMQLAYKGLGVLAEETIIDGNINYLSELDGTKAVIKAEDKYASVAAASIVAKVARDAYMVEMSVKYPGYGFEKHVGYGTAAHKQALEKLGVSPIHRRSFKPIINFLK